MPGKMKDPRKTGQAVADIVAKVAKGRTDYTSEGKLARSRPTNFPPDKTTRRYESGRSKRTPEVGTGRWLNNNGTQLGRSLTEDSDFMPMKSTGDIPSTNLGHAIHIHLHGVTPDTSSTYAKAAKLRNKLSKRK